MPKNEKFLLLGLAARNNGQRGTDLSTGNENMVKSVEFMQAIQGAWASEGPFDLAIEVGPHPALKGPVLRTVQDLTTQELPYTGLLARQKDALESFADGLGYIWTHLNTVNVSDYDKFLTGKTHFSMIKGLPAYAWDHEKEFWHESRYTKAIRHRSDPVHELLGHLTPDATEQEMRWRHLLCPTEIPWLKGHALQHQTVFPAAAYVIMALEAALMMCKANSASPGLIEILDLDICKALPFDSDDARVETVFSLTDIVPYKDQTIDALFKYNAASTKQGDSLELLASGRIRVTLSESSSGMSTSRSSISFSTILFGDLFISEKFP
jgi:hybrid polyketide synthase/nonribosomal peptide synthetase ACE1